MCPDVEYLIRFSCQFYNHVRKYIYDTLRYTRRDQKVTVIFKFRELRMFDFYTFFSAMLVHKSAIFVYNINHFGLSVCFCHFGVHFDFLLFGKMDQRNCINFCVKNEIQCARIFVMLTAGLG